MLFRSNHFYPFAADWQEQSAGRLIAPGLGIYFLHPKEKDWPLSVITRQLHYLRSEGLAGQTYFRCKFLTDNVKDLYNYLQRDFYAYPALAPACTWLDSIQPSAPEGFRVNTLNDQTEELAWKPSTDNLAGGVRYNVYASRQWPVDVSRAENLIATALPEPRFRYSRLAALGYYMAVTAIDRVGNESAAAQVNSQALSPSHQRLKLDSNGHIQDLIKMPQKASKKKGKKGKTNKRK